MRKVIFVLLFVIFLSCTSKPEGSTWLITTASEVISVSQAGDIWNSLEQPEKNAFIAASSPVGNYVSNLGTKTILFEEIDNELYLNSDVVESMKKCWIRNASLRAYTDSLSSSTESEITPSDISNYMDLLGTVVWFSSEPGASVGPVRLPDLPWPLAFALDSMTSGSSVEINGIIYTLDSCVTSRRRINSDSISDYTFAVSSLTKSRVRRTLNQFTTEDMNDFSLDSASVVAWFTHCNNYSEQNQVLAHWHTGTITADELDGIAAFISLSRPFIEIDPVQMYSILKEQAELAVIENLYSSLYPADYSDILLHANRFAVDISTEMLFDDSVSSKILVTDSMVAEGYLGMESIPEVPETRTFFSLATAEETTCHELLSVGCTDSLITKSDCTGYYGFLSPGSNILSEPVTASELPEALSMELFRLSNADTLWHGPVRLNQDLFVIYRLNQIFPAHPVAFEDIKESIRHRLFIHKQEQMEMDWICELESKHNLEINYEVLGDLPSDISSWSEL